MLWSFLDHSTPDLSIIFLLEGPQVMVKKCVRKPRMASPTPFKEMVLETAKSLPSHRPPGLKISLCLLPQIKRGGLLTGNHTTETTPAWALNPGMGKVKVVSVSFALESKVESRPIGPM